MCSLPLVLLVAAERESQCPQECAALVVGGARGDDGDVHPADGVDLVVIDLGEDQLLGDAERVVAPAVERTRVEPAEVADARDRDAHQAVVEIPHPVPRMVTLAPIALPSRSLKPAIDFLARVTRGFCPVFTVMPATP